MDPDESARVVAKDVHIHVLPFIATISSDTQLLEFLVKDEEPFPWSRSQGLARMAEVAKLEAILNSQNSYLPYLSKEHEQLLQNQLDSVSLSSYIEAVRHDLQRDA